MNEKERLLRTLRGQEKDGIPVICPGGMMNGGVTEIVSQVYGNHNLLPKKMAEASVLIHEQTGFENYGVPFCMTCEAEALGAKISEGDAFMEPRVITYVDASYHQLMAKDPKSLIESSRMGNVVEAVGRLKNKTIPVIGNITGPISTASSIVDPLFFLKSLKKDPVAANTFLEYVITYLIQFAQEMVREGADVIAISDPTATGEILGKKNFEVFVLPLYEVFFEKMKALDTPVILHICGNAKNILTSLDKLDASALSFDSIVNMREAKSQIHRPLMGNVSTQLLQNGHPTKILGITANAVDSGVDIVAPACGLGMSTPTENLRAMTGYVKGLR